MVQQQDLIEIHHVYPQKTAKSVVARIVCGSQRHLVEVLATRHHNSVVWVVRFNDQIIPLFDHSFEQAVLAAHRHVNRLVTEMENELRFLED